MPGKKRIWTDKKIERVKKLLGTCEVGEVAKALNVTRAQLLSACSRYGWSYAFTNSKPVSYITVNQKAYIRRYAGFLSVETMAKNLCLKTSQIRNYASTEKFSVRLPSQYCVHTYIPDDDINLMRDLHGEGINCAEIARKFDISHAYAWEVCTFLARTDVI